MSLSLRALVLFSLIFILQPISSFASGTASVNRGSAINLAWDVTNTTSNYNACSRGSNYPAGAVRDSWYGGGAQDPSGSVGLPAITEIPSNYGLSFFTFWCSNPPSGAYDDVKLYVTDCPDIPGNGPGYTWSGSSCTNPAPTVSISPTGAQGVNVGSPITYSSLVSDVGADITGHNFDWQTPSGLWNWQNGNSGGSTDVAPQSSFGGTPTSNISISFTPNTPGVYSVRFSALDNNSTRWTYSTSYTLTVCDSDHRWIAGWCQPIVKINSFTQAPSVAPDVDKGESAALSWSIQDATSCALNGGQYSNTSVGTANNGSITTNALISDTTYTLTCQGVAGPVSRQLTVVVASGSISSPISTCFIAVGQSACPITLSWSSVNMSSPRITDANDVTISNSPTGSNLSRSIGYGNATFSIKNGSYIHGTVTTNATCVSGSSWNGSSCTPINNDPIGNFEGGSCTVTGWACDPDNFATPISVDLKVGATTIGSPVANITRDASVGAQCGGNRVHGFSFAMPVQYQNGVPITVSATAINTPAGNNPSIGSQSVTCLVESGQLTVSPSSCVIASGASTCTTGATWTTSNVSSPSVVDNNTGTILSTAANQASPVTVYASFPSTTYVLKSGGNELDRKTVTTSCAGGNQWNGTICTPTVNVTVGPLSANPATVNYGQTTVLSWSGVANVTPDCTLNGGEFSNVSVGTSGTGSRTTGALTSNTTYTLTCQGNGGPVSSSVTVNVASGNITANPSSCVIAMGQSTCSTALSWTTSNMTSPRVTDGNDTTLYTSVSGSSVQRPITYGTNIFAVKNGSYTHSSVTVTASCALGSSWVVGTGRCDPASTVTVGPLSANPATVNYGQTTVLSWSGVANVTPDCTLNGGEFSNVSVGTSGTGSRTTGALTSNTTYTLTCQGNGGPVSSSVTVNVASGNITANPSSCVIAMGQSTCSTALSWTTSNMTSPRVTDGNDTTLYTSVSGSGVTRNVSFGNTTYSLKNASFVHGSVSISASCASGSAWDGTTCKDSTISGALALSTSTCFIAQGASTCTVTATWGSNNTSAPALVDANTNTTLSSLANRATPFTLWVAYSGTTFRLKDGAAVLDSKFANGVCANGTAWNGSTCEVATVTVTGSLTLSSNSCTVAQGASTCVVNATWSTGGSITSPSLRDGSGASLSSNPNGTIPVTVAYPSSVFRLQDGSTVLDSKSATAVCANNTSWDGSVCAAGAPVVSGTLNVSSNSCTIAANQSTCTITATWNTSNAASPALIDFNTGSTLMSSANQVAPFTVYVAYTQTEFRLKDGNSVLDTKTVTATCAGGTSWNGLLCEPIASVTVGPLTSVPSTVNYGGMSTLSWSGVGHADSCSLNGGEFLNIPVGTLTTGTKTTTALTADTTYTLTCLGYNGPAVSTVTVKVASGDISASPASCVINVNESSCTVGVTWNTLNMTTPRMTDGLDNTLSTNAVGAGVQQQVKYGNNTFVIKNGTISHASALVNATCDSTSKWNGTVCAPATATINSASCTIAKGSPSCSVNVIWSTANTASTVTVVRPYAGNTVFATGASGNVPASFNPGTFKLDVKQGSMLLNTGTYSAICAAGSEWNGSVCLETPNVTLGILSAAPSLVNYNQTSTLSWNGIANATTCSLNGGEFSNMSVGTSETGSQVTQPLTVDTTYVLTCAGPGGPKTSSVTVKVASGTITASPASCTILSGQSSCTIGLNWTSSNMTSPKVTSSLGEIISTGPNGTNVIRLVSQGLTSFSLSNGAVVHSSFSVLASCEAGTAWSGGVCAPASGSINSSSCVITAGNSTCNASVVWSSANTGAVVTVTGPSPSAAVLKSGANGNTTVPFSYGTNYVDLRLNGNVTATGMFLATCEAGTIWTGVLCGLSGISGDLIVSSNECLIPTGFSSCTVNGTWVTSGATNPSLVNETTGAVLSREDIQSTPVALQVKYPGARFVLRENATPLDFENVTAKCAVGGFDNENGTCANPSVLSAVVTGQYYSATGNIAISCVNSNKYRVVATDSGVVIVNNAVYNGPKNVAISQSGNYTVYCMQGDYKSAPVVRYYNAGPPPSPTIILSASPRTVSKASDVTVSWSIQHPKSNCLISAKTICSNGICNDTQIADQTAINNKIATGYVDTANIQDALTGGVKTILSSLRSIPSDRMNTDWTTQGQKTFNINYSTEFVLSCGDQVSQAVRIQVTRTGEQ